MFHVQCIESYFTYIVWQTNRPNSQNVLNLIGGETNTTSNGVYSNNNDFILLRYIIVSSVILYIIVSSVILYIIVSSVILYIIVSSVILYWLFAVCWFGVWSTEKHLSMHNVFLAHLAEGHESLCHGAASVVRPSSVNLFI